MDKPVTLELLQEKGFAFRDFGKLPDGMLDRISSLEFSKTSMPRGTQSSYYHVIDQENNTDEKEIHDYFVNKAASFVKDDPFLSSTIYYMKVGIDKCVKGDFVMPHTDVEYTGCWQVALFYPYPNNDSFEGREFLYGTQEEFKVKRPYEGLAVFIDTTQKHYIHAVRELLSDHIFFAVGINPYPPGGRKEKLIKYEELIPEWGVEVNDCEMETAIRQERSENR